MAKHVLCHLCESDYLDCYRALDEKLNAMRLELEAYFMPLCRDALKLGQVNQARDLVRRCPDDVVKCFMFDAIRQHELGAKST